MFRVRRVVKSVLALIVVGAVALAVAGRGFIKPGTLTVSQPEGIGPEGPLRHLHRRRD